MENWDTCVEEKKRDEKKKKEVVWMKKKSVKGKTKIRNKKLKLRNSTIIYSQYFHNKS